MCEIREVKVAAASLIPLISELFEHGQNSRIAVSGDSMYPFLRHRIDCVECTKGSFDQLSRGDIVLIQRTNGGYILHRVYRKKKDCFFMVGDAQQWIEGPLYPEQLLAVVTVIWRKDKRIACSNMWWRLLSGLWLYLRPFRYFILKVYGKLAIAKIKAPSEFT